MPSIFQNNFYCDCNCKNKLNLPCLFVSELLWTAPEILRSGQPGLYGTLPGDVYSFSIIMQEVVIRGPPFCMLDLSDTGKTTAAQISFRAHVIIDLLQVGLRVFTVTKLVPYTFCLGLSSSLCNMLGRLGLNNPGLSYEVVTRFVQVQFLNW